MNLQSLWVVEYSPAQKSVHVDTISNTIARNGRNIRKGTANGYMIIGLYPSADIAHKEAERFIGDIIESLGLLTDAPLSVGEILTGGASEFETTDDAPVYERGDRSYRYDTGRDNIPFREYRNPNDFNEEAFGFAEPPVDYSQIENKALMELTKEDFESIRLYKSPTKNTDFEAIYNCSSDRGGKIYFTPNATSYTRRGHQLREEGEILTTAQLIETVRRWRNG